MSLPVGVLRGGLPSSRICTRPPGRGVFSGLASRPSFADVSLGSSSSVHTKCTGLNVLNSLAFTFVVVNPLSLYVSGNGAVLSRLHSLPIIVALVFKSHAVIFAAVGNDFPPSQGF